jgi:DNA-binding SARP family transcriptional activator
MSAGIELLGPLTIKVNGYRHRVGAKRARTILAVLALNPGRLVSFDALVDELWPDCLLHNARNALQVNMTRLRRQLETLWEGQLIRTSGAGYLLDVPPDATDANRFLELAERGNALARTHPGEAIEMLRQALQLWRGPALGDVGDGRRCSAAATWLDERRISAEEDLIAAHLQAGGERSAVAELQQLVIRYPEREGFSAQLMLALYRSGRQIEALDVFHRARQWLDSEVGLEPHHSLHTMYQAILAQDPALLHQATLLAGNSRALAADLSGASHLVRPGGSEVPVALTTSPPGTSKTSSRASSGSSNLRYILLLIRSLTW